MSYSTPIEVTGTFKDLEFKLQSLSSNIKGKLSWLTYAFGLTDREVKFVNKKPYIFPAIRQDINSKDPLSMMPSDLYNAYCFFVKDDKLEFLNDDDWERIAVKIACIFYCDLKRIAPTTEYNLTKTKMRQDIIEAFRQTEYSAIGVIQPKAIIEDDIVKIFDGYSVEQIDNKFKMLPKYALRFDFEFGFLRTCGNFNTYA